MASIFERPDEASARVKSAIRPDLRLVSVYYSIPLLCAALALVTYISPIDDSIKFGIGVGSVIFVGGFLYLAVEYHVRWKTARYLITADHLETSVRADLFNQTTRRIPFAYIRDVTLRQSFSQSFFNVSNITVATTNGDKIILENLNDAHETEAAIWELVLFHAPTAAQDNPMMQKGG